MPERFHSLALMPLALLALAAVFFISGTLALAADNAAEPWVVTRKADNRVLPKQDSVADIESGRAMPDEPAKPAAKPAAKPVPAPAPATNPTRGIAGMPEITVTDTEIVIMLPTSAAVTDTRYINLDDPRRLALDVMGQWKYEEDKVFRVGKGPLEKLVLGKHPDFLRLVLHLTNGPVPAEIIPKFQLVEGGLRMTAPLFR